MSDDSISFVDLLADDTAVHFHLHLWEYSWVLCNSMLMCVVIYSSYWVGILEWSLFLLSRANVWLILSLRKVLKSVSSHCTYVMQVWPMTRRRRFEGSWGRLVADYSWYGTMKMLLVSGQETGSNFFKIRWPLTMFTAAASVLDHGVCCVRICSQLLCTLGIPVSLVSNFRNHVSKLLFFDMLVDKLKGVVLYLDMYQTCWTYKFTEMKCVRI